MLWLEMGSNPLQQCMFGIYHKHSRTWDVGGFPNETLINNFARYARVLYSNFGDRVKDWVTFNEPWIICVLGYGTGEHAPGLREMAETPYQCGHNILKAHCVAYWIYEVEFKPQQGGRVGIILSSDWNEPLVDDDLHKEAAERGLKFNFGWFAHPLVYGEYPPIMRELVDAKSAAEGRNSSRLPTFDPDWTSIINGSLDFIGLNHYTTLLVAPANGDGNPGIDGDSNTIGSFDPSWEGSAAPWLKVVPWGIRKLLGWISQEYKQIPIYVTENGFSDPANLTTNDVRRVNYFQEYINQVMKAVVEDGIDVRGYTAWTLIDNFEWAAGRTQKFGIHYINFTDPHLTRVPKRSAICLRKIFEDNGFPEGPACEID